jgi:hypothetical protein
MILNRLLLSALLKVVKAAKKIKTSQQQVSFTHVFPQPSLLPTEKENRPPSP